jgi:putative drug exporter of the RND superfamily
MRKLAGFVTGRRTKFVVVAAWIVLAFVLGSVGSKLADVTNDQNESFLPKSAESTKVLARLNEDFPGGQTVTGLVVYRRDGGLTAADKAKIRSDARRAEADPELPPRLNPVLPFGPSGRPRPGLVSADGSVAYSAFTVPDDNDKSGDWGKALKRVVGDGGDGLHVYLSGNLGFSADAEEVFGSLDTKILLATVLLVVILLLLIYRSPLVALIPLVVVALSYTVATGFVYLYAKSATVSSQGTTILVVLMFGVGTDYCLLLVSRYREELKRFEDKHDAMRRALERTGPAILASGLTVSLAMLVLYVADLGLLKSMGPVSAIGVACAFTAGLTLLPALLTLAGRRGFWPRRRLISYDPEAVAQQHEGVWRRIADRAAKRPGLTLGVTTALFLVGALGLFAFRADYSTTTFFKKQVESVEGFKVIEKSFPAGSLAPTTVLVEREDGPVRPSDVAAVTRRLDRLPQIARVVPSGQASRDRRAVALDAILRSDPYKKAALNVVPTMREAGQAAAPAGVTVQIGGGSAIQHDYDAASERDIKVIVPLALLVIAIILAVLLEAIVAPLVLIASVIVSFFGTLGASMLFIRFVVGDAGVDTSIPTFAFIFLVALGIDYTIFLMSRVREEARKYGTKEGMLRAVGATGPVITSAGVILAGTFSVLMTLPVTFTFDLGFIVALGILLDTFVVRTIMVPSAVELIGDKIWWPSTATGKTRLLREEAAEEQPEPERQPA